MLAQVEFHPLTLAVVPVLIGGIIAAWVAQQRRVDRVEDRITKIEERSNDWSHVASWFADGGPDATHSTIPARLASIEAEQRRLNDAVIAHMGSEELLAQRVLDRLDQIGA